MTLRIRAKCSAHRAAVLPAKARRENWTIPRQRVLPARSPHPAFNPTVDKPPGGGRSRNRVLSSIFRGHHSRGRTYTNLGSNEGDQASKEAHSRGAQGCTGSHPPRALTSPCALTVLTKKSTKILKFSGLFAGFRVPTRPRSPHRPCIAVGARPTDLISLPIPSQASRHAFVRRKGTPRQVVPPVGTRSTQWGPYHARKTLPNAIPDEELTKSGPKQTK